MCTGSSGVRSSAPRVIRRAREQVLRQPEARGHLEFAKVLSSMGGEVA